LSLSLFWLASARGAGAPAVADACGAWGAWGACGAAGCPLAGRTASSRFHM